MKPAQTDQKKYPIPTRLNLFLCLVFLVAAGGLFYLESISHSLGIVVLIAILFSFLMQMGFSLIHEAEHQKLHTNPAINHALGTALSCVFSGSFHYMAVAHLWHHRNNRSDAELIDWVRPGENKTVKTLQYYFLMSGGAWLAIPIMTSVISLLPKRLILWLLDRADKKSSAAQYFEVLKKVESKTVRIEFLVILAFWFFVFHQLHLNFYKVLLTYSIFAFSWSSQQYIYHVGTSFHRIDGAFNLKLWTPLQWLYLNFNFHHSHHRKVNIPWNHMAAFTDEKPRKRYLETYLRLCRPPRLIKF